MTQSTLPINKLLIIGESGVGKTHYGAQLLQRLNGKSGALRMRSAATNITAFEAALERVNEGLAAEHTATKTYLESNWPVEDIHGRPFELVWPDYGGEQVRQMLPKRRIPLSWRERLTLSSGWLLFIRIQHTQVADDVFTRPLASLASKPTESTQTFKLSEQAHFVELLQMLLFVRGVGTLLPLARPALTVLLSCWDELGSYSNGSRPAQVLAERMPLLSEFVATNWKANSCSVLGISALGRPLRNDIPDEEYVDRGPEHFGYVVRGDGTHDQDLTIPIADLASLTAESPA